MSDFIVVKNEELERLEEEIKENIEFGILNEDYDVECIGIENLEGILTRFFNRKITLTLG